MAKYTNDYVLEGALARTAEANLLVCCTGQPTTRAEAVGANQLAQTVLTPGDGNGDFTLANGDTSGRKVTVAAQSGVTIDNTGSWDHVALCDGTRLLHVTTVTSQTLTAGGTVDVNAWDVEFLDVTA